MLAASLLTFVIGALRYFTLKKGLESPGILSYGDNVNTAEIHAFHRVGIRHYLFMLGACFLAVVIERFYSRISAFIDSNSQ